MCLHFSQILCRNIKFSVCCLQICEHKFNFFVDSRTLEVSRSDRGWQRVFVLNVCGRTQCVAQHFTFSWWETDKKIKLTRQSEPSLSHQTLSFHHSFPKQISRKPPTYIMNLFLVRTWETFKMSGIDFYNRILTFENENFQLFFGSPTYFCVIIF